MKIFLNNKFIFKALVSTKYGGHIAFCEGLLPTGYNYSCRVFKEYLDLVLNDEKNEFSIPKCKAADDQYNNQFSDSTDEENKPIQSTPFFSL